MFEMVSQWAQFWFKCVTEGKEFAEAPMGVVAAFMATGGWIWVWWRHKKPPVSEWWPVIWKRLLPKTLAVLGTFYVLLVAPFREWKREKALTVVAESNAQGFSNQLSEAEAETRRYQTLAVANAVNGGKVSLSEVRTSALELAKELRAMAARFHENYQTVTTVPVHTAQDVKERSQQIQTHYKDTINDYSRSCATRVEIIIVQLRSLGIDVKDLEESRPHVRGISFAFLADALERKFQTK